MRTIFLFAFNSYVFNAFRNVIEARVSSEVVLVDLGEVVVVVLHV